MDSLLHEAFERCCRRYPTIQLTLETYQARVDEILSEMKTAGDKGRHEAFRKLHHEDLFLAVACARNDRIAWECFADDYFSLLKNYAVQASGQISEGEDLAQEIVAKLLQEKNRLAGFNGRGSLAGWLRVVVAHSAVDRHRRTKKQTSLDELEENGAAVAVACSGEQDCEDALDSGWGAIISDIVRNCLDQLSGRDRLILSLHYLQNSPLKIIGRQFNVSEAAVSRWIERIRKDIRKQTEKALRKQHRLRAGEIQTLWKWILPDSIAKSMGGGQTLKNNAIHENSSVIKKGELK
jgi:RNA polymerase sigma-70 factor (ECF subfamily)